MKEQFHDVAAQASALDRARPYDRLLGQQIAREAHFDFSTQGDVTVVAVGATSASGGRTVRFTKSDGGISWSCTCTSAASPTCKHAIAAVITAGSR